LLCYDTCLLSANNKSKVNTNTFVADSGASGHMVHSRHLLCDFEEHRDSVTIGDNTTIKSLGSGTFKGYHIHSKGKQIEVTLQDVLLVSDLWVNLFSITKGTSNNNSNVICENILIAVHTQNEEIRFDIVLKHGTGKILAAKLYHNTDCANLTLQCATYEDLRQQLGHPH
jgi:hypothetical protein